MTANNWLGFMKQLIVEFGNFGQWLTTPFMPNVPELSAFTPLSLFSVVGLTAFVSVAVVKWVVS